MPKILVSLRSVLLFYSKRIRLGGHKLNIRKVTKKEIADAHMIISIEYLNFSDFSHL
jgi:hypothetical protein